jgi:hypothetical protein
MAWNGSGTYTQTDGTYSGDGVCQAQAADGDPTINATELDALFEDHAAAINACLAKNGENAATANLNGGGFRLTNITASANTDAGTYGKQVASGAYSSPNITLTLNDATTIDIDVSSLESGTGGVALTGDQEITGNKEFSSLRISGQTKTAVNVIASGASITADTTANDVHYNVVTQNTTVSFTWPTAASDAQLGANWVKRGHILFRNTGAYTISLDATMLAALDYYEEEGSEATGSGNLSTLVYTYYYINGTKIAQFAWVSTP